MTMVGNVAYVGDHNGGDNDMVAVLRARVAQGTLQGGK